MICDVCEDIDGQYQQLILQQRRQIKPAGILNLGKVTKSTMFVIVIVLNENDLHTMGIYNEGPLIN